MAVVALLIYALWTLLAFGLRMWVHHRRTGDTGLRLASTGKGSPQWWAGMLFTASLVTGAAGTVAALAGFDPIAALDQEAVHSLGIVIAVLGMAGTLTTQLAMGDSWRIGVDTAERTTLVTGGPFRWVRNPIFTAMTTTVLGLVLMVPNPVTVAGIAAVAIALQVQVRGIEEPYLGRLHGTAYHHYAATTGRFLPGIGRVPSRSH
ncbi:MAG: methyltransferase family protein [Actinomadura sp.]